MRGILGAVAQVASRSDRRDPGFRERPERIVLAARTAGAPSSRPPVRIFVGTEPAQARAERVFIWSVENSRDPSRVYEIYLMSDLLGFNRRWWLTGFTNYRFAIPHFAGGAGRAIYNDVDQIYLSDPAELFDMDMGQSGFLSISALDTSVMLIDCARMAEVWTLDRAQRLRRKRIEARATSMGSLWGQLPREWNARDEEYVSGRSKLLHYTTIHTQPWQPFPQRFVYQSSPVAHVWLEMERAADAAGYQLFGARHPSTEYRELIARLRERNGDCTRVLRTTRADDGVEQLLAEAHVANLLEYHPAALGGPPAGTAAPGGRTVTRYDPLGAAEMAPPEAVFDAVVCSDGLEYLPERDVPWLIESLFRCARLCLYLSVNTTPTSVQLNDGMTLRRRAHPRSWWRAHIERASARYPGVHWKLVLHSERRGRRRVSLVREGGRRADGKVPTVWVLTDHKAGHTTQSVGLADAIGFPYEIKALRFDLLNHLSNRLRGATRLGMSKARSAPLTPPWPDLVISTGRRSAPVARWIGDQSRGRTRLVQLGRRGGETVDAFDLVVACTHFRLPLHPRRVEITAPINAVNPERLARAAERWRGLFAGAARPHVVFAVGGTSARHWLDAETARRMGERARAFAESLGGSLFAITSPRTGSVATAALRLGLDGSGHVHEWKPGVEDNPYMGYLALADVIVVTGESESMLAEAAAAGKPLFIYPLPKRRLGFRRPAEWIARHAEARPRRARGTVRPQQGLEYVCARLIAAGIIRPPRRLDQLHEGLIRKGVARYFGDAFDTNTCHPLHEVDEVARRVRLLLGFDGRPGQPGSPVAHAARQVETAPPPGHPHSGDNDGRRFTAARK